VTQDGGEDADNSLSNVIHALVFGAGLTVFVVYVFLNSWRSTLITALSLPTSVIAAFIAVWLCGFSLNFMSLLGLSLAIGVLIDDAIVVRENIVRHMEQGEDRRTAAIKGTAEIGLAVTATTLSIVAVFVPVAFMPGVSGEWFRPFGLTVVASVLVSLFISFTLDPMLSAYWGDPRGITWPQDRPEPPPGALQRMVRPPGRPLWPCDRLGVAPPALDGLVRGGQPGGGRDAADALWRIGFPADIRLRGRGHRGAHALQQQPGIRAPEGRIRRHAGAHPAGDQGHQQLCQPGWWAHLRRHRQEHRAASHVAGHRGRSAAPDGRLVGAEYVVLEDLSNGAQKPVQIRFTGTDSRQLLELTNRFMEQLRQVPGRGGRGLE
jgi:HAE1 family hydrophobic/amphiphilic exporter-1